MNNILVRIMYVFHLLVPLLMVDQLRAQPAGLPRSYSPPSPNAANLGLYAVTPVDYYTGVPAISVPIYDIKVKGINLNINLSYHAGGIRQADEASWVGLGWSLNAGGVITRTKRDGDDFSEHGFYKNPTPPCSGAYDQEPDIFYFNFCGRTGKFIIQNNTNNVANIQLISKEMIKVKLTATTGWEITDENGTIYFFEAKENTREVVTYADNSTSVENYISSWYLSKIQNQFGEIIDFTYQATGAKSYKTVSQNAYKASTGFSPLEVNSTYYMVGVMTGAQYIAQNSVSSSYTTKSEIIVDEVLPDRIVFPSGSIEFKKGSRYDLNTHSTGSIYGNKLEEIVIKKGTSVSDPVFKKITMSYGSYNSMSGQPDKIASRLKLIAVTERSGELSLKPYQFTYNTSVLPDKVPNNQFGGFISNVTDGLIDKITYPTGGYTQFTFEPHLANAGARIRTMVQSDQVGEFNVKNYEYVGGKKLGESLGILASFDALSFTAVNTATQQSVPAVITFRTTYASDQCMMGESSSDYLVGYDQVIEHLGDNGANGKNVYTFTNEANPNMAYGVPAEVTNANGYLKEKEVYKNENGVFVITNKLKRDLSLQSVVAVSTRRRFLNGCNNTYSVKCDWMKLNWEEEYTYNKSGANPLVVKKNYYYDNTSHIMPTRIQEVDSKGDTWTKNRKYPFEAAAEAAPGNAYNLMVQRNIVSPVVEESLSKGTTFISKSRTNYKDWYVNQTVIAPDAEEYQKGTSPAETRIKYLMYDRRGNPSEISKSDDLSTTYIWGYDYLFPIAEIKNAKIDDVKYASFETTGYQGDWTYTPSMVVSDLSSPVGSKCYFLNNVFILNVALPPGKTYILSYWLKDGSSIVLSKTGSNVQAGRTINGWTYVQREIEDGGLINITGSGLVDELRYYPKEAQMTTYGFDPLAGLKYQCDINSNIVSYDYDEFGRLKFVRDTDGNIIKTYEYKFKQ